MRTVPIEITTAEAGHALLPRHRVTLARAHLQSEQPTLATNEAYATAAHAYLWDGSQYYAAWRVSTFATKITATADGGLRTASAQTIETDGATPGTMRPGLVETSGASPVRYVYTCDTSGGAWRLRRSALAGTTNPLSLSWSTLTNGTFGSGGSSSPTFVRRIEAVIPLSDLRVVIAEGEHNLTTDTTAIYFWLYDGTSVRQLDTILNYDCTDAVQSETTQWANIATGAPFIAAALDSATNAIVIAANAGPGTTGQGVWFTLHNNVESGIQPIAPVNLDGDNLSVLPCSMGAAGGRTYLVARVTRAHADGGGGSTTSGYDALLTYSSGGWTFGDPSHMLMAGLAYGAVIFRGDQGRYVGNGWTVKLSPGLNLGGSGFLDVSNDVAGWTLEQIGDGADELSLTVEDMDGTLDASQHADGGAQIRLWTSQAGIGSANAIVANEVPAGWVAVGRYGLDRLPATITTKGRAIRQANARDWGRRALTDTRLSFNGQIRARGALRTTLTSLAGLERKTPERGYSLLTTGLKYEGLNEPLIALADIADHGDDFLAKATVTLNGTDAYHLSTVGVAFGVDSAGRGNVLAVAKASSWTGHTQPKSRLRKLALGTVDPDDPTAEGTGWTLEAGMNPLIEAAGEATAITSAVTATYPTDSDTALTAGVETDIAVRVFGRFAYVYTKPRVMTPAAIAQNAGWTLKTKVTFDATARKRWGTATRLGLVASTDVFASETAFNQAEYGDMELSLTDAGETSSFTTEISDATTNLEGIGGGGTSYRILNAGSCLPYIVVGQYVKIFYSQDSSTHYVYVTAKEDGAPNTFDFSTGINVGSGVDYPVDVFVQADGAEWGFASSAPAEMTVYGENVVDDPGAVLRPRVVGGRGAFISNDNTAMSLRYIASDGVRHGLVSGNTTKDLAWDATNPKPADELEGGGSSPNGWRMAMHHGRLFESSAAAYALPASGWMKVDDEVVRYADAAFARRGELTNTTWCTIPTYYLPLAAAAAGATVFTGWNSGGTYPGDDPNTISDAVGLLAEFSARTADGESNSAQWYVTAKAAHQFTVGTAFPHATRALETIAVLSGRGQFSTLKTRHDADAPVTYYPCNSSGTVAHVLVSRFAAWSGRHVTQQDAVTRLSAIAGSAAVFRKMNRPVAPTATDTRVLATAGTLVTLDLVRQLSDFVLDLPNAHLPKPATAWLSVYFRGYYRLDLAQHAAGTMDVRLSTTSTTVTAYSGDRTLEQVAVTISGTDVSAAVSNRVAVRVVVQGDEVAVEVEGQPVWTFDLASLTDGTNSYRVLTAGDIYLAATNVGTALGVNVVVQELNNEADDIYLRADDTVSRAIGQLFGDQGVTSRATQTGGVEWGAFEERDDAGAIGHSLRSDAATGDDAQVATHMIVRGQDASGDVFNEAGVRDTGYRVEVVESRTARTVEQAKTEARRVMREAREFAVQRDMAGFWYCALQPGDLVTLSYTLGSTGIAVAATPLVLTRISTTATRSSATARYLTRRWLAL